MITATITEGECSVCGKTGKLTKHMCPDCYGTCKVCGTETIISDGICCECYDDDRVPGKHYYGIKTGKVGRPRNGKEITCGVCGKSRYVPLCRIEKESIHVCSNCLVLSSSLCLFATPPNCSKLKGDKCMANDDCLIRCILRNQGILRHGTKGKLIDAFNRVLSEREFMSRFPQKQDIN